MKINKLLILLSIIPQTVFLSNIALANELTIKVAGVKSGLAPGAVIGERKCSDGTFDWFRGTCGQNTAGGLSNDATQGYIKIIETELGKSGYTLYGKNSNSLFFENIEQSAKKEGSPNYLIGVTITNAKIDSIQSTQFPTGTLSWNTEGTITTKWEILDTVSKNIVYSKEITTEPSISVPGQDIGSLVQKGIQRCTQLLMEDQKFKTLLGSK